MAIIILGIGKSGSGKSTSLRNMDPDKVALINVLGKPLPFKGANKFKSYQSDDYLKIISAMTRAKSDVIVIDDAGYLMTNQFMRNHTNAGAGNGVYQLYNRIGDNFWNLIEEARVLPDHKRVYFLMHEAPDEFGNIKPKTIGRMVDEKVCLEGMFTIVLRSVCENGQYLFRTQTDGVDVAKSPMGMFDSPVIDNDLNFVDRKICEYYDISENSNSSKTNESEEKTA